MKKTFVFILAWIVMFIPLSIGTFDMAQAGKMLEESDMEHWERYTWEDKLKRSSTNLVTFLAEIPRSVKSRTEESGGGAGWSIGLLEGLGRSIVRGFYGIVELVTVPFDFPDENKAPMLEPEYIWERKD